MTEFCNNHVAVSNFGRAGRIGEQSSADLAGIILDVTVRRTGGSDSSHSLGGVGSFFSVPESCRAGFSASYATAIICSDSRAGSVGCFILSKRKLFGIFVTQLGNCTVSRSDNVRATGVGKHFSANVT